MTVTHLDLTSTNSVWIVAAGAAAGFVNSIVGSGTLISFPTLVGLGLAERTANITNNIGVLPGSLAAVATQRRELSGQRPRLRRIIPCSAIGGAIGALLLLILPSTYFKHIVPFLVVLGVALVLLGPTIQRWTSARRPTDTAAETVPLRLQAGMLLAGVYGGYFGAAQGVIVIGMLGATFDDEPNHLNALKNAAVGTVNLVAAVVFLVHGGGVDWPAALLLGAGAVLGGITGARLGRHIPRNVLRGIIATVGTVAAVKLFLNW